jgi:hypothetical protein
MNRYYLLMFSRRKVKVSMRTTWPIYRLFYSLPHISVFHLLINMHVHAWISEGGLKNVCIYICVWAYILNFPSAEMIIHFHFLGVRTCHVTLFLVITHTVRSLNFLLYLEINNKCKINTHTHIHS